MGLFNIRKNPENQDSGGGILGRLIKMDEKNDVMVWKWPSDNIVKGAVIKVHQTQEALLYSSGIRIDHIGPGREVVVDSANIPGLGKLLNKATGGETTYTFEVWFVNKTVRHKSKIGIGVNDSVMCPMVNPVTGTTMSVQLTANGSYQFGLYDAEALCDRLVGTERLFDTAKLSDFLEDQIKSLLTDVVRRTIKETNLTIEDAIGSGAKFNTAICERVNNEIRAHYGIEMLSMNLQFASPNYNSIIESQTKGAALGINRQNQGQYYYTEQQFDILRKAAENPGAGNAMGIGMGFGMGNNLGAVMGNMVGGMAAGTATFASGAQAASPSQQPAMAPPPLPESKKFFLGIDGQSVGPFDIAAIKEKIAAGIIKPTTLAWTEGMSGWVEASKAPDLAGLFGAVPPPLPPM